MAMKKIILFLALSIMSLGTLSASDIRDLDENNPSYNIIQYLVEEGFLALYDGDEFRGEEPLTRMGAAIMLDKILKSVSAGEKDPTLQEADAIRLLTKEFGPEIIRIDDKIYAFEQRIKLLEDEQSKVVDDVLAIKIEVSQKLSKFEDDLNSLRADLENRAVQQETKLMLDEMSMRLMSIEERMSEYDNKNADGSTEVESQHVFWLFILLAALGAA